mgnify:CR=1 FL=1
MSLLDRILELPEVKLLLDFWIVWLMILIILFLIIKNKK